MKQKPCQMKNVRESLRALSHLIHPSVIAVLFVHSSIFFFLPYFSLSVSALLIFSCLPLVFLVWPLPDTSTHHPSWLFALLVTSSSLVYVRTSIWTPALTKRFLLTLVTLPAPLSLTDPPPPAYLTGHWFNFCTSQQMSSLTCSTRDCDMQREAERHMARCFVLNAHVISFVATMKAPRLCVCQLDERKQKNTSGISWWKKSGGCSLKKDHFVVCFLPVAFEAMDSSSLSEQSLVQ